MLKYIAPLGYLWALPHTIAGLLVAVTYYWPKDWRWSQGCIECIPRRTLIGGKWVGAQTWGFLIFYADKEERLRAPLRVHERVHVIQAFIGGPFYPLAYGLHWLVLWPFKGWKNAYFMVWAERWAYRVQAEYQKGQKPNAWGSFADEDAWADS